MSTITHPLALSDKEMHHFMKLCIALAHDAMPVQEVPVSALYVHLPTRTILGSSFNQTVIKKNGIRHCEVECLTQLEQKLKTAILSIYPNPSLQQPLQPAEPHPLHYSGYMDVSSDGPTMVSHSVPLTHQQAIGVLRPYLIVGDKCVLSEDKLRFLAVQLAHNEKDMNIIQPKTIGMNETHSMEQTDQSDQALRSSLGSLRSIRSFLTQLIRSICTDIACVVSVEPCIMCTGVLTNAGIRLVYAGCGNDKFGGCGSITSSHITFPHSALSTVRSNQGFECDELKDDGLASIKGIGTQTPSRSPLGFGPQLEYNQGCMKEEAIKALQVFYLRGNPNAPDEKRQRTLQSDYSSD